MSAWRSGTEDTKICCCPFNIYGYGINAIRFIIIGIFILWANYLNRAQIDGYQKYCCSCYYISLHPNVYGIDANARFDLSKCIPTCTTCAYCKSYFNHSAQAAFDYISTNTPQCPIDGYSNSFGLINSNWHKATGCHKRIHISSLKYFETSYRAYGDWALATSCIYAVLSCILSYCGHIHKCKPTMAEIMTLWNIVFAVILLYLIFVPFQYYHHEMHVGVNNDEVICEIDSIDDSVENWLSNATFAAIVLLAIVYPICLVFACMCNKQATRSRKDTNTSTNVMTADPSTLTSRIINNDSSLELVNNVRNAVVQRNDQNDDGQSLLGTHFAFDWEKCRYVTMGFIIIVFAFIYFSLLLYATVLMLIAGARNDEYDGREIFIIFTVFALLLSTMDVLVSIVYQSCKTKKQ